MTRPLHSSMAGIDIDTYFVGWDVGGWNCDKNGKSRDAIVILNENVEIVGQPWRGNLRVPINDNVNTKEWISALFSLCGIKSSQHSNVFMAIDTPLTFSDAFVELATRLQPVNQIGQSDSNPYLYRDTEHHLFRHGLRPLSAIKDMIGSQATKGMHTLAKFAPRQQSRGVWTDGIGLTAIEGYPSACKNSETIMALWSRFRALAHEDLDDALTCAFLAYLFATDREKLDTPDECVAPNEGWIWVPKDVIV